MTGTLQVFPYEIKEIEWSIDNFFKGSEDEKPKLYDSPGFSFADTDEPWFLFLYPRWGKDDEYIFLKLFKSVKLDYSVDCYFGLKRSDGSVQQLNSGILAKGQTTSDDINLIKKSELLKRESELLPGNILTINCTFKFLTEASPMIFAQTQSTKLIKDGTVCEDYKKVFFDGQNHDFKLEIGGRKFPVHRDILRARSRVFDSMLSEGKNYVIDVPKCDPKTMEHFLLYIYCGQIEILDNIVLGLYFLADKFHMATLKGECLDFIKKWMSPTNICEIIEAASDNYPDLLMCATEYFCNNVEDILDTAEWQSFMKDNSDLANDLLKKSVLKLKNSKLIDVITLE